MSNTQSNSSNNTKTVLYYGKEIQVPNSAAWIHTDSDGAVYTTSCPATTGDNFYLTGRARAVHSFNHTEMSTINWMLSQKRIQDLPSVSTGIESEPGQKAHPHADLMLKYAQIAQYSDKPWEELQYKSIDGVWLDCGAEVPFFYKLIEYRLKPQPIRIKVGQVWRGSDESTLIEVLTVKHPDLQKGSIVVALRINPEFTLYSELTMAELQEHFTLVK